MTSRLCLPWPHPILRSPAAPVAAITNDIRAIWADMIDTMDAMPGYGLAAPQIGIGLQTRRGRLFRHPRPGHPHGQPHRAARQYPVPRPR